MFTTQENYSCDDFIQISDCDMVLVYLGKGVFHGTKEKPFLHRPEPKGPVPRPEMDDEYVLPVYKQESPPWKHFKGSMGSAPPAESPLHTMPEPSDTEAASDSSPALPTKKQECPRWPKKIVVKEKVYKIRRGSWHCCKQCTLCHKYFESQRELNDHTSDVHSFHFLCHRQSCGKDFISQASLDKHSLTHQSPRFHCTVCGNGFLFKYQLDDHSHTHTDFEIKCRYPRCYQVYKSQQEYNRHYKVHSMEYKEYTCDTCGKKCTDKKNLDEHMAIHSETLRFECPVCGKKFRWWSSLAKHSSCKYPPHSLQNVVKDLPDQNFKIFFPLANYITSWLYT